MISKDRHIQWWIQVNWMSQLKIKTWNNILELEREQARNILQNIHPTQETEGKKSPKMYLKPQHKDIRWYMSLYAPKSTPVQKPMPQLKLVEKKLKHRDLVSLYHTPCISVHLFHHLLLMNHTKHGQSGTEIPASQSWSKSKVSVLYFWCWKKVFL